MRVAQVLDFLLPRRGARRAALPQHLFNKSLPVSGATTVLAKRGRVRIKMRTVVRLANRDHVTCTVRNSVRTLRNSTLTGTQVWISQNVCSMQSTAAKDAVLCSPSTKPRRSSCPERSHRRNAPAQTTRRARSSRSWPLIRKQSLRFAFNNVARLRRTVA